MASFGRIKIVYASKNGRREERKKVACRKETLGA